MALVRPSGVPRSKVTSASLMSMPMTRWPSSSSRALVAAPIPDADPVTTMVLMAFRSYCAAVDTKEGARRVAGRVAGEVDDGAHDLFGLADALETRAVGGGAHGGLVPVLDDVGPERPRDHAVHADGRAEGVGQAHCHRVDACLRGCVGNDSAVRPERAD